MMRVGALAVLLAMTGCAEPEGFGKPTDVAFLSDGLPVVTDGYVNSRVVVYRTDNLIGGEWGAAGCGEGEFDTPHGVTVDGADRIYVADRNNARVQVFDRDGNLVDIWGKDLVGRPWGLEFHEGVIYIVDGGDQDPDHPFGRVVLMTPEGERLTSFGSAGTGPGQFLDGHDITVDSKGRVYVAELIGKRVQRFNPR